MQRRIPRHQRHPARIRAQIHGAQIRVTGEQAHIKGINAKNFGNDARENVVRALPDFRRAAENAHAATAIEFQLYARMRHLVPVNGQARSGQISRASDSYAVPLGELPEFVFPVGNSNDSPDTFGEIHSAQPQKIGRYRVRRFQNAQAQICRVHFEFFGDFVELHFLAKARLRRAVTAFGSARRLVGERAAAFIAVARNMIGGRLKSARVVSAGNSIRTIRAAVDQRPQMHAGDRAVFLHAGPEFHQHRMAPAVAIENFFARQADFYRTVEQQRSLRHDDFVVEGIALAAKPAAVRRGNHANVRWRHLQHFCQSAMQIMRRLRAGPDGQFSVRILDGHRSVLLDGKMRASLVEERVLKDFVRFRNSLFHVAEFQRHKLVNVSFFAVFVDARLGSRQRLFGIRNRRQNLVIHIDQVQGFKCRQFLAGYNCSDRITHVPHMIDT